MAAARTLADRMRRHFGDADHLYAHLLGSMADDWEAGGPVREVCRGWESAPHGAVVQLRLLAGLFRIVLTGRAPQLERFYPCLGGTADPRGAWAEVKPVLAAHMGELRDALTIAPQTNEVGRSAALLVGLFEAARRTGLRRLRLLELGASAGLNLLVDRFHISAEGWSWGPAVSPVQLRDAVVGAVKPEPLVLLERRCCDIAPVDISTEEGRLRLRSFVWPFHVERHERLAAALQVAQDAGPPVVDRAGAGEWLEQRLSEPVEPDALTVVWHSVTRQYWPDEDTQRVGTALEDAAEQMRLAHIAMEYPGRDAPLPCDLSLTVGNADPMKLGTVADHGIPVTLATGR